jgi:hypothetical protein
MAAEQLALEASPTVSGSNSTIKSGVYFGTMRDQTLQQIGLLGGIYGFGKLYGIVVSQPRQAALPRVRHVGRVDLYREST